MLRIAVPNKGSLSEAASAMLKEAGYRQRSNTKELTLVDSENQVEFFYLRPRDIALYVADGTLDVGITGRDLLADSGANAAEVLQLGFGRSKFHYAGPSGTFSSVEQLAGKRIATSYPGIVRQHLSGLGIEASVTRLDGAVESSIQLGVADAIADVVETGTTLKAAGLAVFGEVIMTSEAVMIRREGTEAAEYATFVRRLEGVLVARSYVMMDFDIAEEFLAQATALAPGLEGPTVSPLARPGWVAVRVMVPRAGAQKLMDDLYDVGARAILTTGIHAARL